MDLRVEGVLVGGVVKLVVPIFEGKSEQVLIFQHELTLLARCDVFTKLQASDGLR